MPVDDPERDMQRKLSCGTAKEVDNGHWCDWKRRC